MAANSQGKYRCGSCVKRFKTMKAAENHLQRHHGGEGVITYWTYGERKRK